MARKEVSVADYRDIWEVGRKAEADFQKCLVIMGAKIVSCPNGEAPGYPVAVDPGNDWEDQNGVDRWLWIAEIGFWIPLDITISTDPEYLARKRAKCLERGIVMARFRRETLDLAAKGGVRYLRMVRKDLLAALRAWMPKVGDRLLTRQEVAAEAEALGVEI